MGANMKKSFPTSCNRRTSTSTLPRHHPAPKPDDDLINPPRKSVTLEEMILQLELEEERARRATLLSSRDNNNKVHRRMSCVDNSDILRSARNALNQYPRFSLDGKDAMYKSSFNNSNSTNAAFLTDQGRMGVRAPVQRRRASSLGGETVVWCNPGVVGRLMGLEAVPVPVRKMKSSHRNSRMDVKEGGVRRRKEMVGGNGVACSSSRTGYCVMRPVSSLEIARACNGWENTHALF